MAVGANRPSARPGLRGFWTAPAERKRRRRFRAGDEPTGFKTLRAGESGVALRLPPQSKTPARSARDPLWPGRPGLWLLPAQYFGEPAGYMALDTPDGSVYNLFHEPS